MRDVPVRTIDAHVLARLLRGGLDLQNCVFQLGIEFSPDRVADRVA